MRSSLAASRAARRWSLAACAVTAAVPLIVAAPAHAGEPPTLASLSVSPSTITAGHEAIQTVTLNEPAPAGGTKVIVYPQGPYTDWTYFQATRHEVTVPEGRTSVGIPIRVQSDDTTTTSRLIAFAGNSRAETTVTVVPQNPSEQAVTSFTTQTQKGTNAVLQGSPVTGKVELKSPAPIGGLAVDIRTDPNPNLSDLQTPYYVVIPAGATSATFTMTPLNYDRPELNTVTADVGGAGQSVDITSVPKKFTVGAIAPVRQSGGHGVVGLGEWWHPFGAKIELTSDNAKVSVPPTVQIPADQIHAKFKIDVAAGAEPGTTANITAKWVLGPTAPVTTQITVGN
ncbi:hypothetical protein [Actinomadura rudentiformis]|uniref:Uncharacterized protein n=1 Tax=Actinomadura rudentiformis TaxID=359158 RepID=A0A6H9YR62_9ACTN|nr:hypothetical protein [Actinomadura rudentiformis]KAB2350168.1 hypothetical protein F8566_10260 [Actinomadura rudentiformis]